MCQRLMHHNRCNDYWVRTMILYSLIIAGVLFILELLIRKAYAFWYAMIFLLLALVNYVQPGLPMLWQSLATALLLIIVTVAWWYYLKYIKPHAKVFHSSLAMVGRQFSLTEDMKGNHGKIEIDKALWYLKASSDFLKGTQVEVYGVDGVILKVTPVSSNEKKS